MIANSVLDKDHHARLLADMDHVCRVANIPPLYVHQSAKSFCAEDEIDFLKNFRSHRLSTAGMVLVGRNNPEAHCMAMCGALVRNFIDARVLPLGTLLTHLENGTEPDPTVMVIPNLFVAAAGKTLPAWKITQLHDLLIARFTSTHQTIMAVESLEGLAQAYGPSFLKHLQSHYRISKQ